MRTAHRSLVMLPLALIACVLPSGDISPYGRAATVYARLTQPTKGELLAVSRDTVWLWSNHTLSPFALANVLRVAVDRHAFGTQRTMWIMTIVGATSGLVMRGACRSAKEPGKDCNAIGASFFGFSVLAGALFSIDNHYSSIYNLYPGQSEEMRPYSRFPQGLPDSIRSARPQ